MDLFRQFFGTPKRARMGLPTNETDIYQRNRESRRRAQVEQTKQEFYNLTGRIYNQGPLPTGNSAPLTHSPNTNSATAEPSAGTPATRPFVASTSVPVSSLSDVGVALKSVVRIISASNVQELMGLLGCCDVLISLLETSDASIISAPHYDFIFSKMHQDLNYMVLFLTDWTKKKSEFQQMQRNDVHIQIRTLEDTFMRHLDAFIALYQVESTTSTELCELQAKISTIQSHIHTSGSSESRNTEQATLEVFQEQFCRISGHTPDAAYIINGKISYRGAIPVNQRTMFDVYKGELHGGEAVAIKHFRQWLKNDDLGVRFVERIMRQVQQWSSSSSPFILECRGIGIQTTPAAEGEYDKFQFYLVSPFMKRQDAVSYIRKLRKEGADVNILKYLQEAARGIEYLHHRNPSCVHAGVRGENIIIKDDDTACLNGFGITKVVAFTRLPEYMGFKYKYRWMAPELLAQDKSPMKPCDIWAWAMTALELITGQKPYYGVRKLTLINHIVTQGKRPELSDYPTFEQNCPQPDRLWALLERCWVDASDRPSIREVISELEDIERVQIEQQVAHEWAR